MWNLFLKNDWNKENWNKKEKTEKVRNNKIIMTTKMTMEDSIWEKDTVSLQIGMKEWRGDGWQEWW